jgi:hypothetical protein
MLFLIFLPRDWALCGQCCKFQPCKLKVAKSGRFSVFWKNVKKMTFLDQNIFFSLPDRLSCFLLCLQNVEFFFLRQYVQPCLLKNPKYTFYIIKSSLKLAYIEHWMRLDSALNKVVPNISRPKKSRHFLMKLPDNFQMREHSWPLNISKVTRSGPDYPIG